MYQDHFFFQLSLRRILPLLDNNLFGAEINEVLDWISDPQIALISYDSDWNAEKSVEIIVELRRRTITDSFLYATFSNNEFETNSSSKDNNLFGAATNQDLDWKYNPQTALIFYNSHWNAERAYGNEKKNPFLYSGGELFLFYFCMLFFSNKKLNGTSFTRNKIDLLHFSWIRLRNNFH